MKETQIIVLSEANIHSIINGRTVTINDEDFIIQIRQSYSADVITPLINDKFQVHNVETENLLKDARRNMLFSDTFERG